MSPPPTGTDTMTTDLFPSQTDVSLYYTVSGKQGPGAITGSATAATLATTSTSASTGSQPSGKSASGSSSKTAAPSTSTSKAGAAPTGVLMGAFGVVGVGMVMVAL